MPLLQAAILAIVQGITEFLPISSSAHLAVAPWLLGWKDQGLTFDIALHFGTLLAVLLYFFRDIVIATGYGLRITTVTDPDLRDNPDLIWKIAAATVPVGLAGILAKDAVETTLRNPWSIGFMLIAVGLVMGYADRNAWCRKTVAHLTWTDAALIGLSQALAIVPGTSRSGITITTALFLGFDRLSAARFSFLLSFPAISAAAAKAFYELYKAGGIPPSERTAFVAGMVLSALAGCAVIGFFLHFLKRSTLKFFVAYRVIFGILIIALAIFRR